MNIARRMCPALILIALWLLLSVGVAAQSGEGDDPNVTIHVVQRGENLYRIALKYGLTLDEIARVNSLANPSNIQVGQRLLIPLTPSPVIVPPTTHTVQPGDNLQSIAALYSVEVQTLVLLNGIANPNALFVGQVLTIRPEEEFSGPPPTPTPTPPPVIAQSGGADDAGVTTSPQHVIQRGETLFTIAQRYGITTAELQAANDIADPSLIYAGQSLRIPGVEAPPSAVQLPPAITAIDITPLIWAAGGTGRVRLTTPPGSTVNATFLDRSLPVIAEEAGARHTLFVGVPLTAGGGIYPLALVITSPAGLTEFAFNVQVDAGAYGTQYITLPADKAALATQAVEENEYNILRDLMSAFTAERYFDGPMGLPAAAPMNARFGSRRVYNGSTFTSYHNGADFAGAMGTPVLAAAPGRVVLADTFNVRGLSLILDHGWGVYTVYSHMSQRYANLGEFVGTGQTIGLIGSSGRATGAHLHWELWVNGTPVDPMQWVAQAFP